MNRDYKISNDGTIFEIKDDGSIAKLAKIDDNGRISTLSGEAITSESGSKGCWFFILTIVFLIAFVILANENNSLKQERDNAKSELSSLESKISNTYPLIITDIEIANVTYDGDIHTNYGNTLYSSSTMYLQPRIKYIGLTSGYKTLEVKWYYPDETIIIGTSSPSGFSQSESVYIYNGDNTLTLASWGYPIKGLWTSGTYRIEIWYGNSCLRSKTFTIY